MFPRSRAGPYCRGVAGSENRGPRAIASDGTPIILSETAAVCLLVRRGWLISVVEQSGSRSGPHFSKRRSVAGGHSRRFGLCQSVRSGRTSSLIEKTSLLGRMIRRCYQKTVRSEIGSDHFRQPENSVACITQHHPTAGPKCRSDPKSTLAGGLPEIGVPEREKATKPRAGEGIRTLDIYLGKVSLCQLSYTR